MLKILHITKRYPPYIGGTETLCHDTCTALKNKFNQKVFAYNDKPKTEYEVYDGIDLIRVGVIRTIASQPIAKDYGKLLLKTIKEFQPDIIHFDYPNPYGAYFLLKIIKKLNWNGKFVLFWVMDIVKQKKIEWVFHKQTISLLNKACIVQMLSPVYNVGTSYLPYYSKDYRVLSPRVGDARLTITFEQQSNAEKIKKENFNKTICFFFGRHVEYKGLRYLIEADNYLNQDEFEIYIGGEGPLTKSLIKQAAGKKNIHFLGRLSNDDINSYLIACDIFCFPSITRNEAFGISLAEAMWFGKPGVTFTIPGSGVNWVSLNNKTGLEVPNRDSKAYGEAIIKLANDKNLYNRLSKAAYERAHELFSTKNFNKNALEIYLAASKK